MRGFPDYLNRAIFVLMIGAAICAFILHKKRLKFELGKSAPEVTTINKTSGEGRYTYGTIS